MNDAQRIIDMLRAIGLPAPEAGDRNELAFRKMAEAIDALIAIARAAQAVATGVGTMDDLREALTSIELELE